MSTAAAPEIQQLTSFNRQSIAILVLVSIVQTMLVRASRLPPWRFP